MKKNSAGVLATAILALGGSSVCTAQSFSVPKTKPPAVDVTGVITCAHCLSLSQHKGFTPWSWAMSRISEGDDIVIQTSSGKVFRLKGDRQELSKYICDKATVSGTVAEPSVTVNVLELAAGYSPPTLSTIEVANVRHSTKKGHA
jgi:hypothetical protein